MDIRCQRPGSGLQIYCPGNQRVSVQPKQVQSSGSSVFRSHSLGAGGAALIAGATGANPTRSSASSIEAYLGALTQ